VISIAHLDDQERMFFVSRLLNGIVGWMRRRGTSSLRALVYFDEIFGSPAAGANPPSKAPLLTILKQARAFGLALTVATQNPVDLDYKALANAGTWMLGRLQTDRDKARVLDGLEERPRAPRRSPAHRSPVVGSRQAPVPAITSTKKSRLFSKPDGRSRISGPPRTKGRSEQPQDGLHGAPGASKARQDAKGATESVPLFQAPQVSTAATAPVLDPSIQQLFVPARDACADVARRCARVCIRMRSWSRRHTRNVSVVTAITDGARGGRLGARRDCRLHRRLPAEGAADWRDVCGDPGAGA
jgi:hypothetical protein